MLRRLVAIVGPTASGKSAIALALAQRLGGEIVNADSRQVYAGMEIGTAAPSAAEKRLVRHHLYGFRDPRENYSLALYQRDARAALDAIWARDQFAWLIGGTGQYAWGLLENWSVPEVAPDEALRAKLGAFAQTLGAEALHEQLRAIDPIAADQIDARNIRRVIRAIEVFEHTGVPISTWQTKSNPDFEFLLFSMRSTLDLIDERIGRRVDAMFEAGFEAEVAALLTAGVSSTEGAMSSIGYREVTQLIRGELTRGEAIESTKRATRRLARRQAQWFRKEDRRITWVDDADDIEMQANIFTGACTNASRRA